MRIELMDWADGRTYSISTRDTQIAAAWLGEHVPRLATLNAALPEAHIRVWADDRNERELLGFNEDRWQLNQDGLLHMAQVFLDASQRLAERTSAQSVQGLVDQPAVEVAREP